MQVHEFMSMCKFPPDLVFSHHFLKKWSHNPLNLLASVPYESALASVGLLVYMYALRKLHATE